MLHDSTRVFKHNRQYSRLGAAVFVALLNSNDDEIIFDPEPIYNAHLSQEWFLMMPYALSEVMSKLFLLTMHVLRIVLYMTFASR